MAKYYFGNHKTVVYHSNYLIAEVIKIKAAGRFDRPKFPTASFCFRFRAALSTGADACGD